MSAWAAGGLVEVVYPPGDEDASVLANPGAFAVVGEELDRAGDNVAADGDDGGAVEEQVAFGDLPPRHESWSAGSAVPADPVSER